jgi:hypothetical protein
MNERFRVVPADDRCHWLVCRGETTYGEYLSRDAAIEDALEAAQESGLGGRDVEILAETGDCLGASR